MGCLEVLVQGPTEAGSSPSPAQVCEPLPVSVLSSGEALYPTSNSLLHGTHVPTKEGVDRMVADLEKQ